MKSEGVNKNLDSYTGTLVLERAEEEALDGRNVLYRGFVAVLSSQRSF